MKPNGRVTFPLARVDAPLRGANQRADKETHTSRSIRIEERTGSRISHPAEAETEAGLSLDLTADPMVARTDATGPASAST